MKSSVAIASLLGQMVRARTTTFAFCDGLDAEFFTMLGMCEIVRIPCQALNRQTNVRSCTLALQHWKRSLEQLNCAVTANMWWMALCDTLAGVSLAGVETMRTYGQLCQRFYVCACVCVFVCA